jgi:ADP-L-glycero-D-manno-heptose 6-epimerase
MYVITGGAGFIGSNLIAGLERKEVGPLIVCDHLGAEAKWNNLRKREISEIVPPQGLIEFLEANASRIQAVFHMGAISSTTEIDSDLVIATNFTLSLRIFEFCARNHVRLIYASSAATYGDGSAGFDDADDCASLARFSPLNVYGWSKHLFDRRVARMREEGATLPPQWVGLKFFNVYGPNEYHKGGQKSVAVQLYPRAVSDAPAILFRSHNPNYPDGGQMRDFVWVGDVVDVMLWLLEHPEINGIYNLGSGRARSFLDLAAALYRAAGKEPRVQFIDTPPAMRDHYQYFTEAKMDRLRGMGYTAPFTGLEEGIGRYVTEFLGAKDPYL